MIDRISPSTDNPAASTLRLACPAKVNLALSVGGPRAEDGYHPIASWMVAVALGDTLELQRAARSSRFEIGFDPAGPVAGRVDWPLEKDLAYRAHRALEDATGRSLPVVARVAKRIPTGAGLGGGSSDAAAMLVGLNRLFELGMDASALGAVAARLGSDVPFLVAALQGQPSAVVRGLGEAIESVTLPGVLHVVLVLPPWACPTGPVYRAFDELRGHEAQVDAARVRRLAATWPVPSEALFNDLADAAARVEPRVAEALAKLRALLQLPVHVTGSGAAMFVVAPDPDAAARVAEQIKSTLNLPAVATQTL